MLCDSFICPYFCNADVALLTSESFLPARTQISYSGNSSVLCAVFGDTIDLVCSTSPNDQDVRVVITRQPGGEEIQDGFGSVSRVIDVNTTNPGIAGLYRCTAMHPVCGDQESDLNIMVTGGRFIHTFVQSLYVLHCKLFAF